jgi:uncharacterized membrane protein
MLFIMGSGLEEEKETTDEQEKEKSLLRFNRKLAAAIFVWILVIILFCWIRGC